MNFFIQLHNEKCLGLTTIKSLRPVLPSPANERAQLSREVSFGYSRVRSSTGWIQSKLSSARSIRSNEGVRRLPKHHPEGRAGFAVQPHQCPDSYELPTTGCFQGPSKHGWRHYITAPRKGREESREPIFRWQPPRSIEPSPDKQGLGERE